MHVPQQFVFFSLEENCRKHCVEHMPIHHWCWLSTSLQTIDADIWEDFCQRKSQYSRTGIASDDPGNSSDASMDITIK